MFADFDLDGWKDLYVTNGYKADYTNMDFMAFAADQQIKTMQTGKEIAMTELLKKIPAIEKTNYAFKNNGDLTFTNHTNQWGLEKMTLSNGAAYADLDNDGDLDLITNDVNAFASVYRNLSRENNPHHYLKLRFHGDTTNLLAFSTRADLYIGDSLQTQTLINSRGYQSAIAPELVFGLGLHTKVDSMIIKWPNGQQQRLVDIAVDQTLTVNYQHQGPTPVVPVQNTMFLRAGLVLNHHDHAGVGALELVDAVGRLACWRHTLSQNLPALRVISELDLHRDSIASGQPVLRSTDDVCPKCKAPIPPGEDECPICTREETTAPSTWTLFRLWRFARPYRWPLLAGFLLTLASTAAQLVPPYLTMPLMDNVLIPFQNGKPIDWQLVGMYLGGLLGAAGLAWLLGWIRTYILALVSERMGGR